MPVQYNILGPLQGIMNSDRSTIPLVSKIPALFRSEAELFSPLTRFDYGGFLLFFYHFDFICVNPYCKLWAGQADTKKVQYLTDVIYVPQS